MLLCPLLVYICADVFHFTRMWVEEGLVGFRWHNTHFWLVRSFSIFYARIHRITDVHVNAGIFWAAKIWTNIGASPAPSKTFINKPNKNLSFFSVCPCVLLPSSPKLYCDHSFPLPIPPYSEYTLSFHVFVYLHVSSHPKRTFRTVFMFFFTFYRFQPLCWMPTIATKRLLSFGAMFIGFSFLNKTHVLCCCWCVHCCCGYVFTSLRFIRWCAVMGFRILAMV